MFIALTPSASGHTQEEMEQFSALKPSFTDWYRLYPGVEFSSTILADIE
jgi:hypothetical protein